MGDGADLESVRALRDQEPDAPAARELQSQRALELQRRGQQHGGRGGFAQERCHHRRIAAAGAQLLPGRAQAHPLPAQRLRLEHKTAQLAGHRVLSH